MKGETRNQKRITISSEEKFSADKKQYRIYLDKFFGKFIQQIYLNKSQCCRKISPGIIITFNNKKGIKFFP